MTPEDIKALKKEASTRKRLASDVASKIHDLVEDRYWTEFTDLPALAAEALAACEAWQAAQQAYDQASREETA